jgi:hypothetical protein
MTRVFRLAMALAVTSIMLVAPIQRAHAGPPPPPGGGGPTSKPKAFFLFGQQTYTYYDADWVYYGPGTLTVTPAGTDPYNGATLITVQLTQGAGRNFYGSGVSVSGELYFSIGSYFFQCDTPGWGSYHVSGYPGIDHWVYLQ